jgi:hypothetical protein
LAAHAGATVIATASGDNEAYVKSIGASQVIDYREAQFEKVLREKVDVVFDLVGGDTQKRSFLVLKEGGHLVSATQPVSQEETAIHHVTGVMMRLAPSADGLGRIGRLLEEGTIRPDVATVYGLQDAAQRISPGTCRGFMGCRPVGREGQDTSHTARSCFVWPRFQRRDLGQLPQRSASILSDFETATRHQGEGFKRFKMTNVSERRAILGGNASRFPRLHSVVRERRSARA